MQDIFFFEVLEERLELGDADRSSGEAILEQRATRASKEVDSRRFFGYALDILAFFVRVGEVLPLFR